MKMYCKNHQDDKECANHIKFPKCAMFADTFLNAQWKQFLLRFVLPEPIFFNVNINIRGTPL